MSDLPPPIRALVDGDILSEHEPVWFPHLVEKVSSGLISDEHLRMADDAGRSLYDRSREMTPATKAAVNAYLRDQWTVFLESEASDGMDSRVLEACQFLRGNLSTGQPHGYQSLLPFAIGRFQSLLKLGDSRHLDRIGLLDYLTEQVGMDPAAAEHVVGKDPLRLFEEMMPSYSITLHAVERDGERLFLKLHRASSAASAAHRARIETAANYTFSRDPVLRRLVPGTDVSEIAEFGELALSVQRDVHSQVSSSPGTKYWLDAYAALASRGGRILDEVELPHMLIPAFDKVCHQLEGRIFSAAELKGFESRYDAGRSASCGEYVVLSDTSVNNRLGTRFVDMERLCRGNLAVPLSLFYTQQGIFGDEARMNNIFFTSRLEYWSNGGIIVSPDELSGDVEMLRVPLALRELGGLTSREENPVIRGQKEQLLVYLMSSR